MNAPTSRAEAVKAWKAFLPKVAGYAGSRNHVIEGHGNVSRLSAAIRYRLLLEDEVIEQTLEHYSFRQAEKWLQEVCWRRYWKGWLEMRPDVWVQWRRRLGELRDSLPSDVLARAEAVAAGESGVACMDVIAKELNETGYLHNHARMWWASFWIHVEGLPWELGAEMFFRHLLDADPASNMLSWRWVAGLQTRGKTYLVRLSNLERYAGGYLKGNEAGSQRIADDQVKAKVIEDSDEAPKKPMFEYPNRFLDGGRATGLWLHPDDLAPEIGPLAACAPVSVVACLSVPVYREVYGLSDLRIESLERVVTDGLGRASAHFGCVATKLKSDSPAVAISEWAVEQQLEEVVAFAPMVGPIRDMVPGLRSRLEGHGIKLTLIRRESDQVAFSFAGAGFFPFWQKMSRQLSQS